MKHISDTLLAALRMRTHHMIAKEIDDQLVLTGCGEAATLDRSVSVSAPKDEGEAVWDDQVLEEQHRRFLDGYPVPGEA